MPLPTLYSTSRYPWDEWLNGQLWYLLKGRDYLCQHTTLISMAYQHSLIRDLKLASSRREHGILIQTYPVGSLWKPNLINVSLANIKKHAENWR